LILFYIKILNFEIQKKGALKLAVNIKKIKKAAAKKTIKEAKQELFKMKEKKIKVDPESFEEYVKILYEKNFDKIVKESKNVKK